MTTIEIDSPRIFASDTLFTTGPASGSATKEDATDPLIAQGIIPGAAYPAQHLNHELHSATTILAQLAGEARRNLRTRALRLRELSQPGLTPDDNAESMAAISIGEGNETLALKVSSSGILLCSDSDRITAGGVLQSITSLVTDAARNGSRIVVVGTGGNANCFSTDNGGSWTAGGVLGGACGSLVYNATYSRFMAVRTTGSLVHFSTDATSWSSANSSLTTNQAGIAVLANGNTVVCGTDGGVFPSFSISTNGGTSWADTGGTIPSAAGAGDPGWVCGNAGAKIWHVSRVGSDHIVMSSSTNGTAWTEDADIQLPANGSGQPRILCCPDSGLLVVAVPIASGTTALLASTDGGLVWSEPSYVAGMPIACFAVAGGRLFATVNGSIFASDGVGLS